jgi:hypothetical protein
MKSSGLTSTSPSQHSRESSRDLGQELTSPTRAPERHTWLPLLLLILGSLLLWFTLRSLTQFGLGLLSILAKPFHR